MNRQYTIGILLLATACYAVPAPEFYRMCVPSEYYHDCLDLLKDPSEAGINMKCVEGRDRVDCLNLIEDRKADVLAGDPEDMYVAYHLKNEDFRVISEFRTEAEKDSEFRYKGIILVKKGSNIHSLKDLEGKKSCHTGFGRNVGYKVPITKLKNHGLLKVSTDESITATERELKALSEFFPKACLVGTYSPFAEVDKQLKKKYSNLCALCENPSQCNYPDKYSGYDGAIRCLDKGEGEVAFSKTLFVKKYFGLAPAAKAEGNPSDFEYLCEDGSRRPVTGPACSWAQRPWRGYISNADNVRENGLLRNLQERLDKFFNNGLKAQNKDAAKHLLIDQDHIIHDKPEAVEPKTYLEKAGYKEIIERDGSMKKVTFCISDESAMNKCDALRRAAFSRDIRPEIECMFDTHCIQAVEAGRATVTLLKAEDYIKADKVKLEPLVYETRDNFMVLVADSSLNEKLLEKSPIKFDVNNARSKYAALLLNQLRGGGPCDKLVSLDDAKLEIVNSKDLDKYVGKNLVCPDNLKVTKPLTDFRTCNFEANLPNALFVHSAKTGVEKDTLKHLFISISAKFGTQGSINDVFQLFGRYKDEKVDSLFSDDATAFTAEFKNRGIYDSLTCKNSI